MFLFVGRGKSSVEHGSVIALDQSSPLCVEIADPRGAKPSRRLIFSPSFFPSLFC